MGKSFELYLPIIIISNKIITRIKRPIDRYYKIKFCCNKNVNLYVM